ncbi:monovalent cation:proton antiporter-2 (CPA2) family protein [uncultured Parvibaculum sp.]|mgnify:CR=1 FL=1|uniref:monovalent cation:proton antiporter-2 (CPA2) family protein n=1 Tax=uncultured Parvibaculum sp. TaxID=291828 RepID=UPI0030D97DAA|tara:strand:- start:886 stop:2625 length:1740 start_codon:yes stop_codon:yes gene_type:complete
MEDHSTIPYLREVVIFLIAAGVVVPLFHRLRISPVLGYLIVGGLIGPFGLALWADRLPVLSYAVISDLEGVQALAELGIIFLLFTIGLELSLDRLWAMRRLVFGLGSLQIVITGTIIGLVAWEFGNSVPASIVLGACLALSSTAIVMQLLMQSRRLATPLGRSSFSILLMQDLAVVPILFVVGVLGAKTGGNVGLDLLFALGKAVVVIVAIYAGGRLILRPALRLVAQSRSPEMFMAAILLAVIGISAITGATGLSMALGAFLAGLLLAETEFRHEVEVDIEPFKGLMLGLFFMSVGMGIDWRVVGDEPFWIIASVAGLFVLKTVVTAGLCLAFGLPRHTALEAGLLLGQGGEFAFIVVGLAMSLALLPPDVGQFMLIVAGLTMLVTPLVASAAGKLAMRMERDSTSRRHEGQLESEGDMTGHVILAGFGRVGQTLATTLEAEAVPYLALDADAANVAAARAAGLPVFYGDAARLEMLNRAHIDRAQAVVVTMDAPAAAEKIVREIRQAWPDIPVYVRARDGAHAARLNAAGATMAVPETIEASLQLAGRVLSGLGASDEVVQRRLAHQRIMEETLEQA